jgi:fatty acid desaturase
MLLLMTASLVGAAVFGGLGLWAGDLLLTFLIVPFGGTLFAAVTALAHKVLHPNSGV